MYCKEPKPSNVCSAGLSLIQRYFRFSRESIPLRSRIRALSRISAPYFKVSDLGKPSSDKRESLFSIRVKELLVTLRKPAMEVSDELSAILRETRISRRESNPSRLGKDMFSSMSRLPSIFFSAERPWSVIREGLRCIVM